jgi:EAL domain-containing protein (putative c-di-GMP-specific phosphodiesterase class I)
MNFEDILSVIEVDQLGVHSARFGALSVRAHFRPIYEADGDELRMTALMGEARVQLNGLGRGAADFHDGVAEIARVAGLGRALIALNRANTGIDGLSIIIPSANSEDMDDGMLGAVLDASDELACLGDVAPARLICELPAPESTGMAEIGRYASSCRRRGVGVALGRFDGSAAAIEVARAVCPEIVSIDAGWFKRVTGSNQAARLLKPLFRAIRGQGTRVHVGALTNPAHVAEAREAGADLYSGRALAGSMPAGAFLKPLSIPLETFAWRGENVVQLFA